MYVCPAVGLNIKGKEIVTMKRDRYIGQRKVHIVCYGQIQSPLTSIRINKA